MKKKYDPRLSEIWPLIRALGIQVQYVPRYTNWTTTKVVLKDGKVIK